MDIPSGSLNYTRLEVLWQMEMQGKKYYSISSTQRFSVMNWTQYSGNVHWTMIGMIGIITLGNNISREIIANIERVC
jgi:hypothetical protein